jgi:hypothetical protein
MLFDNVTGGGWVIDVQGTTNVVLNTWYHFAVVRNGNVFTAYLNGVSEVTATNSLTLVDNAQVLTIGALGYTSGTFISFVPGYISNVRLVKGTAVYTSAFTPPTAPLTAITNTSLLLNFTNAGIIDNAEMNNLETVGNAQISTAQSKFGGGSIAFDGTGDYLVMPQSPNLDLGAGDFTLEAWVNTSAYSAAYNVIVNKWTATKSWLWYITSTGLTLFFSTDGSNQSSVSASATLTTGTWRHLAVTRASGSVRFFVDGVQAGTTQTVSSTFFAAAIPAHVGILGDLNAITAMNGYIDDLRITKGYARYTANFTPPSAPFPTQ